MEKLKRKPLRSPVSVKAVRWKAKMEVCQSVLATASDVAIAAANCHHLTSVFGFWSTNKSLSRKRVIDNFVTVVSTARVL